MTKDDITAWALSAGWRIIGGHPSLSKPQKLDDAIIRLNLKATVVQVEVRKPSGKWEKIATANYPSITAGEEGGLLAGLGLERIPSLGRLMQDNRDAMVFR